MKLFKLLRNWFRKRNHIVIDTCILLSKKARKKLGQMKKDVVIVPIAVYEQLLRRAGMLAGSGNKEDDFSGISDIEQKILETGREEAKNVVNFIREMVRDNKNWWMGGSRGTGIVKALSNKRIRELGSSVQDKLNSLYTFRKRAEEDGLIDSRLIGEIPEMLKKIDAEKISETLGNIKLKDVLGSTDIRILATCVNLKRKHISNLVLVTRDKSVLIIAQALGIDATKKLVIHD